MPLNLFDHFTNSRLKHGFTNAHYHLLSKTTTHIQLFKCICNYNLFHQNASSPGAFTNGISNLPSLSPHQMFCGHLIHLFFWKKKHYLGCMLGIHRFGVNGFIFMSEDMVKDESFVDNMALFWDGSIDN